MLNVKTTGLGNSFSKKYLSIYSPNPSKLKYNSQTTLNIISSNLSPYLSTQEYFCKEHNCISDRMDYILVIKGIHIIHLNNQNVSML